MKLFVGLGNPGAKYEKTRHNIGFLAVDEIARAHGFCAERTKFQAILSEGKLGTEKVLLLKPQTFMNLSGQSVGEAMRFYKLSPEDVTVFHDELDLAPGKLRAKTSGGHAGHNGLRSCHEHIGADYHRIRIGIGHPGDKRLVSAYVLHDFAKADWEWITPQLEAIAEAAPLLAKGDSSSFMSRVGMKKTLHKPKSPKTLHKDGVQKPSHAQSEAGEAEDSSSPAEKLAAFFAKKT